jgi:hypothetical protein
MFLNHNLSRQRIHNPKSHHGVQAIAIYVRVEVNLVKRQKCNDTIYSLCESAIDLCSTLLSTSESYFKTL